MKNVLAPIAGVLGCLLLALYAAGSHRDLIQEDLWNRTKAALADSPVRKLAITADGREITLRGVVPTEEARRDAARTVENTFGVHTVTNLLEVQRANAAGLGAPVTAKESGAVACQQEFTGVLAKEQIVFQPSWYAISPESFPLLDRLLALVRSCPHEQIEISGHTDPYGTLEANMALSRLRAQEVANYFIAKGIPKARLTVVGHGPNKPVADNNTPEGMKKNRRIDFTVIAR